MASKPNNIRWITTGSQPYLKIMYSIYYIQFSTNMKMYNYKNKTSFFSPCLRNIGSKKTSLEN